MRCMKLDPSLQMLQPNSNNFIFYSYIFVCFGVAESVGKQKDRSTKRKVILHIFLAQMKASGLFAQQIRRVWKSSSQYLSKPNSGRLANSCSNPALLRKLSHMLPIPSHSVSQVESIVLFHCYVNRAKPHTY